MSDNRAYWLVEPGSPVLEVITAALDKSRAFHKAVDDLAAEFGTDKSYTTTNWQVRFLGLAFDGTPPEGWRANKKKPYATPDTRTKLGREIAKRVNALPPGVAAATFSAMLNDTLGPAETVTGNNSCISWGDDCSISWTGFEKIGSQYVLSVPAACKVSPPGCRELKMSEYWRLKEEAEKAVPA
jgi:hypothetical protein